jgi:hypothetical protein
MFNAIFEVFEAFSKLMSQYPDAARYIYYGFRKR